MLAPTPFSAPYALVTCAFAPVVGGVATGAVLDNIFRSIKVEG